MSFFKLTALLLVTCFLSFSALAQAKASLSKPWNAYWIAVPEEPAHDYGVYFFRRKFTVQNKPSHFVVHVSADNRYKLFINGHLVSLGPARGDLFHWNYETIDIASYLNEGENIAAAIVWNEGESRPEAQISYRTAFIVQGNSPGEEILNTNNSWKCIRDKTHEPLPVSLIYSYYVTGPGELVDMNQFETGWLETKYNDIRWKSAQQLFNGAAKGVFDWSTGWMLVPRSIPQVELTTQRLQELRKTEGIQAPNSFPSEKTPITIPANTTTTLLLDQGFLTNAYPTIIFSNGKNSVISLSYAEALYVIEDNNNDWRSQHQKGNRNEIDGKRFVGKEDRIISNGSMQQSFTSLWYRTYRYLQLKIETKDDPLILDDIYGTFTGYPFQFKAKLQIENKSLQQIIDIAWRTARLCAMETYMDCPYYEQLQYVGDTRIQALVSLFNSGDDRLMRNAIDQLDHSRMAEGITLSRFPSASPQEIPPFSLWWIGMLHDYWMYRPDTDFVKNKLPGIRQVLHFFSNYQDKDGSLVNAPYWNFTDWANGKGWNSGVAPIGRNGNSAEMDLQLLWAYQLASVLEANLGMKEYASLYKRNAELLKKTLRAKYWDEQKKLFADTPEKDLFSQHTNALALLTGTALPESVNGIAKKLLDDTSLTQATIYFKYYVHQALIKAGFGNNYLNWLDVWKENIKQGMTTWAEISDVNNTRSDCHAWGAHPNIELFRTVLGIDAAVPGFKHVKIEPHLGVIEKISGAIPHPNGMITVAYEHTTNWMMQIDLPANTPGVFIWKGKKYLLKPGRNELRL
jgi:alpha-L-rhamnosidase